jgi:hypothetical protein
VSHWHPDERVFLKSRLGNSLPNLSNPSVQLLDLLLEQREQFFGYVCVCGGVAGTKIS